MLIMEFEKYGTPIAAPENRCEVKGKGGWLGMGGVDEAPEYISAFVKSETEGGKKYAVAAVKGEPLGTK